MTHSRPLPRAPRPRPAPGQPSWVTLPEPWPGLRHRGAATLDDRQPGFRPRPEAAFEVGRVRQPQPLQVRRGQARRIPLVAQHDHRRVGRHAGQPPFAVRRQPPLQVDPLDDHRARDLALGLPVREGPDVDEQRARLLQLAGPGRADPGQTGAGLRQERIDHAHPWTIAGSGGISAGTSASVAYSRVGTRGGEYAWTLAAGTSPMPVTGWARPAPKPMPSPATCVRRRIGPPG